MKKILYKRTYFPESVSYSKNKMKVKLDLSNYTTKSEVKRAGGVDTSNFAKKNSDLATLKLDVDDLHFDNSKTVPTYLTKLSNVVDNVVTKTVYGEVVKKVSTNESEK